MRPVLAPPSRALRAQQAPLIPAARVQRTHRRGGGVALAPRHHLAAAVLQRLLRRVLGLLAGIAAVVVAAADAAVGRLRRGTERLLWCLGYVEIALIEPRAPTARLLTHAGPRGSDSAEPFDSAQTTVYFGSEGALPGAVQRERRISRRSGDEWEDAATRPRR